VLRKAKLLVRTLHTAKPLKFQKKKQFASFAHASSPPAGVFKLYIYVIFGFV
jgi:hypothetical protein